MDLEYDHDETNTEENARNVLENENRIPRENESSETSCDSEEGRGRTKSTPSWMRDYDTGEG